MQHGLYGFRLCSIDNMVSVNTASTKTFSQCGISSIISSNSVSEDKMERETKCIQAGYEPKNGESRMIPIIQSTTFKYDTSEDMGKLFDLEAEGYF